jgi:hypothetical protein
MDGDSIGTVIKWIPASTAAKMLRVSRQRVYTLVRIGQLIACHLDGHTLVKHQSVVDRMEHLKRQEVHYGSRR